MTLGRRVEDRRRRRRHQGRARRASSPSACPPGSASRARAAPRRRPSPRRNPPWTTTGLMGDTLVELGIIVLLVLLNGVFVAAEIALVSLRPSRVDQLVEEGSRGRRAGPAPDERPGPVPRGHPARASPSSASSPRPSPASAWPTGLEDLLERHRPVAEHRRGRIALIIVTVLLSLFTIVFGELVPKTLGARPCRALRARPGALRSTSSARVFGPLVAFLTCDDPARSPGCSGRT